MLDGKLPLTPLTYKRRRKTNKETISFNRNIPAK
jgi:hypothetical protein